TISKNLTDEYTTQQLIDEVRAGLKGATGSSWGPSGAASLSISSDQVCVQGSALAYRFKFWGEANVTYRITWIELTRLDNGVLSKKSFEEEIDGNGGLSTGMIHR